MKGPSLSLRITRLGIALCNNCDVFSCFLMAEDLSAVCNGLDGCVNSGDCNEAECSIGEQMDAGDFLSEKFTHEEAANFEKIINVFRYYKTHSLTKIRKDYMAYSRLSEKHRQLLYPRFPSHLTALKVFV